MMAVASRWRATIWLSRAQSSGSAPTYTPRSSGPVLRRLWRRAADADANEVSVYSSDFSTSPDCAPNNLSSCVDEPVVISCEEAP